MKITKAQRRIVTSILYASFKDNGSTNFVVKQDRKRERRIKTLIRYSLAKGEEQGKIYLTSDHKSCAIVLYPEQAKTSLKSIYWTMRLIFGSIGLFRIGLISRREKLIKQKHPQSGFMHLWYIGVDPASQGQGSGSRLMQEIIADSQVLQKPIFLETSNPKNFTFYERLCFVRIAELDDVGHPLKMYWREVVA